MKIMYYKCDNCQIGTCIKVNSVESFCDNAQWEPISKKEFDDLAELEELIGK